MTFENDSTNEIVEVKLSKWGKYEFWHDSLMQRRVFRDSLEKAFNNPTKLANYLDSFYTAKYPKIYGEDFNKKYIVKQNELYRKNGYSYLKEAYCDTGNTVLFRRMEITKDDVTYTLTATTDTANNSSFINTFFDTFTPIEGTLKFDKVYGSKIDLFFTDYYGKDTVQHKVAKDAISKFNFQEQDIPKMKDALTKIATTDKDYYDTKNKWIKAIANTYDSANSNKAIAFLKEQYEKTLDTSIFQNNILNILVTLKTKESFAAFKKYFMQDPPLDVSYSSSNSYDNNDYESRFNFYNISDSLALAKTLFPEILQLTSINEYESKVLDLLQTLIDSSKITAKEYENYIAKLLFDAKIAYKKQLITQEKMAKDKLESEPDEDGKAKTVAASAAAGSYSRYNAETDDKDLIDYVNLLMPFYEINTAIPGFINKLWSLQDENLQYQLLLKMIKINKPFPDTLITHFAKKEIDRGDLYYKLVKLKKENIFPKEYLNQNTMSRAFLYTSIPYFEQIDSAMLKEKDDEYNGNGSWGKSNNYDTDAYSRSSYDYSSNNEKSELDSIEFITKETVTINKKTGLVYIYKYRRLIDDKWRFAISGLQPNDGKTISYINYLTELTDNKIEDTKPIKEQIAFLLKKVKFKNNPYSAGFFEKDYNNRYNHYDY